MLFDHPEFDTHEQVRFVFDEDSGLRAIHAIHRTRYNSSLGGIRCRNYPTDSEALADVLHLARTMTNKAVMAKLDIGGAKIVILGEPSVAKSPDRLRALGRYIDSLDGGYICAPDVGTNSADMDVIGQTCRHKFVSGMGQQGGTTATATAQALLAGLKGAAKQVLGGGLGGLRIAVQGAGGVGSRLAHHLAAEGAKVLLSDIDETRAKEIAAETGAEVLPVDEILFCDADILSPNALGGIFDKPTIDRLRVPLICGAANTQLAEPAAAEALQAKGIVWVPDYVVSPGGIIAALQMVGQLTTAQCNERIAGVYDTTTTLLQRAQSEKIPPEHAAANMVRETLRGEKAA